MVRLFSDKVYSLESWTIKFVIFPFLITKLIILFSTGSQNNSVIVITEYYDYLLSILYSYQLEFIVNMILFISCMLMLLDNFLPRLFKFNIYSFVFKLDIVLLVLICLTIFVFSLGEIDRSDSIIPLYYGACIVGQNIILEIFNRT